LQDGVEIGGMLEDRLQLRVAFRERLLMLRIPLRPLS